MVKNLLIKCNKTHFIPPESNDMLFGRIGGESANKFWQRKKSLKNLTTLVRTYVRNRRLQACLSRARGEKRRKEKDKNTQIKSVQSKPSKKVRCRGFKWILQLQFEPIWASETLYFRRFLESKLGHFLSNYHYVEKLSLYRDKLMPASTPLRLSCFELLAS